MKKVFHFLDYRQFLKVRFTELKKSRRHVTHRSLMQKAGFTSPNFLKLVMDGKRNLSKNSIEKIAQAMELDSKELIIFRALVEFNQAKSASQKDHAYDALRNLRKDLNLQRLSPSQFDYFKNWSMIAIRELATLPQFKEDPQWISDFLMNKVSVSKIKKNLQLLEKLGVFVRNKKGHLKVNNTHITTDDETMLRLAKYKLHKVMINKGLKAMDETPSHLRDMSTITVAISQRLFKEVTTRIKNFRREILSLCEDTQEADSIYQMNIQLFNLSEIPWKQPSKKNEKNLKVDLEN